MYTKYEIHRPDDRNLSLRFLAHVSGEFLFILKLMLNVLLDHAIRKAILSEMECIFSSLKLKILIVKTRLSFFTYVCKKKYSFKIPNNFNNNHLYM